MKNIDKKDKKRLLRKQQATVFFYRICYSLHKPWKFIFVLPILFAFIILWRGKESVAPEIQQPLLSELYVSFSETFIVLTAGTGVSTGRKEVLFDDEF